jgi:hypothetical protein
MIEDAIRYLNKVERKDIIIGGNFVIGMEVLIHI